MKVLKQIAFPLLLVAASCDVAGAQSLKYPPSSHDPGCGGIFCNPIDPQVPQAPAPACQGLLCALNPSAFQPPLTAAQAQEAQRAQAEAAVPGPAGKSAEQEGSQNGRAQEDTGREGRAADARPGRGLAVTGAVLAGIEVVRSHAAGYKAALGCIASVDQSECSAVW